MNTLTIAPLATPQSITLAAWQAITHAPRLFLQTIEHPSARCVLESGLPFESMDDLYRSAEDFDALTSAIVQRLLASETDAVYAVPGRGIGEAQRAALCCKRGWRARLLSALFWLCGSSTLCAARTARSKQSAHPFCNSASMPARSLCSAMHRRNRYAYACGGS